MTSNNYTALSSHAANPNRGRFTGSSRRRDRSDSPPMTPEYAAHIAATPQDGRDAERALARAWRMLVAAGMTAAADRIEAIGSNAFGAGFTTVTTQTFTAQGPNLSLLIPGTLARAWQLLVKAGKDQAVKEVEAVGKETWSNGAWSTETNHAVETA